MMTIDIPVSKAEFWTNGEALMPRPRHVERQARALVARHHCFRGHEREFEFVHSEDVLTVRGRVPTFYLKQMLQTMLKDLRGIARIDNQVDVVSSHGLSSVRK